MKPNIVVLTSTFPRWKGDKQPMFVHDLCLRLSEKFTVTVIAPHAPRTETRSEWDGIKILRFRYFLTNYQTLAYGSGILSNLKSNRFNIVLIPFFLAFQFLALVKVLRDTPCAAIHAHWLFPQGILAVFAAKFIAPSVPVICTSHGGDLFGLKGRIAASLRSCVLKHSKVITVVSDAMKVFLLHNHTLDDSIKVQVIPMGVDLKNSFIPTAQPKCPYQLLFVGRMVEKKGIEYLIQAMSQVAHVFPQAKLTVVGDGPYLNIAKNLASSLELNANIEFLGAMENLQLPALYQNATFFVAPFIEAKNGDQEGLGLVMVEAMGCGCAVIASDMPAVRDVVINNETGILVPQRDSQALASEIIRLMNSPEATARISRQGRHYVSHKFDWEIVSAKYATLLEAAIDADHSSNGSSPSASQRH